MRARRLLVMWSLLGCLATTAAETTQLPSTAAQPDVPVSETPPSTTPPVAKPAPDVEAAPAKPAATESGKKSDGDFKPSEDISEDMAVAYPVDI